MNMTKFAQALRILADAIDEAPVALAGPDVQSVAVQAAATAQPEPVKRTRSRNKPGIETEVAEVQETPAAVVAQAAPAAVAETTPAQVDQPTPEEVTQLDVRQALIALAKRTNNPEAPLSVLAKYNARSVSELSPNAFAAIVRECAA